MLPTEYLYIEIKYEIFFAYITHVNMRYKIKGTYFRCFSNLTNFTGQNTRCKIQIKRRGTQEEQTTLDHIKPTSVNHITLSWSSDTNVGSLMSDACGSYWVICVDYLCEFQ